MFIVHHRLSNTGNLEAATHAHAWPLPNAHVTLLRAVGFVCRMARQHGEAGAYCRHHAAADAPRDDPLILCMLLFVNLSLLLLLLKKCYAYLKL
jgi:hypothetical protein